MEEAAVLVTGAGRGIGAEVSRQLARRGERVVITGRDGERGKRFSDALRAEGYDVFFEPLDVARPESVVALGERMRRRRFVFKAIVNNAGVALNGFDADVAMQTLDVNFFGPLRVTDALLPCMQDGGRLVMVSSEFGQVGCLSDELRAKFLNPALDREGLVALVKSFVHDVAERQHAARGWPANAYRVSKAALNALTRVLARELVPRGMRVNSVCPGWVRTDMGGANAARSVTEGALGVVWAAELSPEGPTGGFFRDGRPLAW